MSEGGEPGDDRGGAFVVGIGLSVGCDGREVLGRVAGVRVACRSVREWREGRCRWMVSVVTDGHGWCALGDVGAGLIGG